MASTDGLVPITRAFLARFYDEYPLIPLSEEIPQIANELCSMSAELQKEIPLNSDEELVAYEASCPPPHKLDENMWKNREHIEEILFLLEKSHWPKGLCLQSSTEDTEIGAILTDLQVKLKNMLTTLESFQRSNSDRIFSTVMTYMPQDFRGTLIRQQRERSERNKQAEVDSLVNSGGSIREQYALLWKQQMGRRLQLAQLGSAAGVYKAFVKYLIGVPQVLLDFIRQLNDDDGPMEEQRQRYGPSLYSLTRLILSIRLFLLLSWGRYEARKLEKDKVAILERAVHVYTSELDQFIKFIGEVFANSPFFITAEDAHELRKNDEYKEIVIAAGKNYEVTLIVESVNSYIAWDFSLVQGKMIVDIGFSIECIDPSGEKTLILPYRRYEADQGNFFTCIPGSYKLIWDNSYSTFFKKNLKYKVDAIPPVSEARPAEPEG